MRELWRLCTARRRLWRRAWRILRRRPISRLDSPISLPIWPIWACLRFRCAPNRPTLPLLPPSSDSCTYWRGRILAGASLPGAWPAVTRRRPGAFSTGPMRRTGGRDSGRLPPRGVRRHKRTWPLTPRGPLSSGIDDIWTDASTYAEPMATREECNSTLAVGGPVGAEESGHGGSNSIGPPGESGKAWAWRRPPRAGRPSGGLIWR